MSTRPRPARGVPPRAREPPLFVDEGRSNFRFAMATAESSNDIESVARNKRARHDYHIMETWEAGLVLTGTEVKSLRNGKANLTDAYGVVNGGEVYLINLHISPYDQGNYFKHERAKVAIALGKGKKLHDKRADLRKKDDERDMARAVRHR